jgi:16S rRNA processing protein RimM
MAEPGFVRIGKIIKAHGLKGAVKVYPYGGSPTLFKTDLNLFAVAGDGTEKTFRIEWAKPGNRVVIVSFSGIDDRDRAESLAGFDLFVDRAALPELEAGVYYWSDIIGLDVYTKEDQYLGRVNSIIPTGSNDVYVVDDGETETLIPALEWVVLSIDPVGKTMQVDLPEGL